MRLGHLLAAATAGACLALAAMAQAVAAASR